MCALKCLRVVDVKDLFKWGCGTFTSFDMVMIHCVSQLETRLETENDFCE